jgi:hypothetical protein
LSIAAAEQAGGECKPFLVRQEDLNHFYPWSSVVRAIILHHTILISTVSLGRGCFRLGLAWVEREGPELEKVG